jgi:cytochrome c peroxidase
MRSADAARLIAIATLLGISLGHTAPVAAQTGINDFAVPKGLKDLKVPENNPLTKDKVELGKQLYFDPRLSRDNTVSCASCHDPEKGWSNGERFATGVRGQKGGRSAPTIINAAYHPLQFWDGRADQLEGQALGPIQNPIEMDLTLKELLERLNAIPGYKSQFEKAFSDGITEANVARAIASFERTILSGNAPYDDYKAGNKSALSAEAELGRKVFFGKGNCSACHSGPNFSDAGFHNIGIGIDDAKPDIGRQEVSQLLGDRGAFKTPILREIAKTAPYMHDGRLATLEEVIEYYVKGGTQNPQLDEEMFPLKLSDEEKKGLKSFLVEALSSRDYPAMAAPPLPE